MPTCYALGGLSRLPSAPDTLNGWTEVFVYNPTGADATAVVTAYFEDRPPVQLSQPLSLAAKQSTVLVMPDDNRRPDPFDNAGFWALKLESGTTLDTVVIQVTGPLNAMPRDTMYKGGVSHLLAIDLHRHWHFAHGLWLDNAHEMPRKVASDADRFNKLQMYYFLNPGRADAHARMNFHYGDPDRPVIDLTVPAERLVVWRNDHKVKPNQSYGLSVIADAPIAATSIRYIYSLAGLDDWGMHLHCAMPGQPAGPARS